MNDSKGGFVINVFNPSKLSVKLLPSASEQMPVDGRKYTLTHSDATGDLFLSIGYHYDISAINKKIRDEFLAEWVSQNGQYMLKGTVYVSAGEFNQQTSKKRFRIFQQEINLALTALINGDRRFFSYYPKLLHCPIYVHFVSIYPEFNQVNYYWPPL